MLERQLPESDSRQVVYQLVVPQLVVIRFPRRRTTLSASLAALQQFRRQGFTQLST